VNPLDWLTSTVTSAGADLWIAVMLFVWNAALWLLDLVFSVIDLLLTPDLSADGPAQATYQVTFWLAGALALTLGMVQLGVAAARRDGKSLGRLLIGMGQFVVVWGAWTAYAVAVLAASSGLTDSLMQSLLRVGSLDGWRPWGSLDVEHLTDGMLATVLGVMGLVVLLSAVAHVLVMLVRGAALLVLAVTAPICAAGLLADVGRGWFWKSVRWFHAAAFAPVLMVLVLGLGVKLTTGVVVNRGDAFAATVGTAVPGVMLLLIAAVAPMALFKLLAFVDPGTSSGAAMRAGLQASGGVTGVLRGHGPAAGVAGGTTASQTDEHGRSAGESAAESTHKGRFTAAASSMLGPAGKAAAAGLDAARTVGARAATVAADLSGQMGVGDTNYVPDFDRQRTNGSKKQPARGSGGGGQGGGASDAGGQPPAGAPPGGGAAGGGTSGAGPAGTPTVTPPAGLPAAGGGAGGSSGGTGGGGAGGGGAAGGAGAGGGAAAAGSVPVVPV
jgi:hypothetical protein